MERNIPAADRGRTRGPANAAALLVSMGEFALSDIAEARQEIELVCRRLATKRRTDEHLATLAHEIEQQRNATLSDEDFCASDVRFHRALVEAAGNPALEFAAAGVIESLQPAVNMIIFRFAEERASLLPKRRGCICRPIEGEQNPTTDYLHDPW
jgi:GntR family transcriptional regulator, transcriptional repressor for pyruvate dehydrogenase complex